MKNLTILVLTAALLPACIITTDGTSDTDTAGTSNNTTGGASNDTTGGTTGGTESGTTAGASDSVTESGTTMTPPTTGEDTTAGTTEGTTGGTTEEATTGPTSPFGMCGWVAREKFYGCADEGAEPGVSDPDALDPIECSPKVAEDGDCSDVDGPVGNIGCCAPNGDLFLCDSQGPMPTNKIQRFECGA